MPNKYVNFCHRLQFTLHQSRYDGIRGVAVTCEGYASDPKQKETASWILAGARHRLPKTEKKSIFQTFYTYEIKFRHVTISEKYTKEGQQRITQKKPTSTYPPYSTLAPGRSACLLVSPAVHSYS